ncbi:MAG: hypothetical protein QF790_07835 [Gammaproteobacteria bacterium]|jgi:small-conductance mechanosensitive channel|nr:hypothetical protein [Gammaproteobacteria bacterium]MDP6617056.1 hypothetical protein [Gammaproteobacteria bacterium]MDP6695948.1 hypothetical protein [Gammaproteobacteria bacterium]
MTPRQLGVVGIVLLGLWILLQGLSLGIQVIFMAFNGFTGDDQFPDLMMLSAGGSLVWLVLAILPCAWLIWNREKYAEKWFGRDQDSTTNAGVVSDYILVGLVLIAVISLISGVLNIFSGGLSSILMYAYESDDARLQSIFNDSARRSLTTAVLGIVEIMIAILIIKYRQVLASKFS